MSLKNHIGCSGWQYDHWKGIFYPDDIAKKNWLPYYKNHFDTIEVNASFYHLPRKPTVEKWKNEAGELCTISKKLKSKEVFFYFKNDFEGHAVHHALKLKELLLYKLWKR